MLDLVRSTGQQAAIERALRDAIRSGRLVPGSLLPSTRVLADDLGVARGTVVRAYAELGADGWVQSRPGARTRVAADLPVSVEQRVEPPASVEERPPRFDFRPGRPELGSFPISNWMAALRRSAALASGCSLGYGDPRGSLELRTALARHLACTRGVICDPADVVICAGGRQSISLSLSLLRALGATAVGVESYTHPLFGTLVPAAGLEVVPIPVDEAGARPEGLPRDARGVGGLFLFPCSQVVTGATLSPERRMRIVDWAREHNVLLFEDDYGAEFRYDGRSLPSLQSIAPDVVLYGGTTSKALAPGLRISWLVPPRELLPCLIHERELAGGIVATLDQLALADLLTTGAYDRHVRRMRRRYRARLHQLRAELSGVLPADALVGLNAGVHALIDLTKIGTEEAAVLARAADRDVAVHGLATHGYRFGRPEIADGLVVGYGAPPQHQYRAALAALRDTLAAV